MVFGSAGVHRARSSGSSVLAVVQVVAYRCLRERLVVSNGSSIYIRNSIRSEAVRGLGSVLRFTRTAARV